MIMCAIGFIAFLFFTEVIADPSSIYGSGKNSQLGIYQKYISPIRAGIYCPMNPSCSQYSKIAFSKTNAFSAYFYTMDRLSRCGHNLSAYDMLLLSGKEFASDPFEDSYRNDMGFHMKLKSELLYPQLGERDSSTEAGDELFVNEHFNLALMAYYKELIVSRDSNIIVPKIAKCLYLLNKNEHLKKLYLKILTSASINEENKNKVRIILARSLLMENQIHKSIALLINATKFSEKNKDEALYLLGINYLLMEDWEKAGEALKAIASDSRFYPKLENDLEETVNKLDRKSPWVAGIMSAVIPGSGYAYNGRYQTGIASLILNGLFIWVSVESFRNKNYAIGSTSALLGTGWYIGNIIGSYNASIKFNTKQINHFMNSIFKGDI